MPMEKVQFEFPDPDKGTDESIKTKDDGSVEIVIEGRPSQEPQVETAEKPEKESKSDDIDIEVVDDTPKKDRGRKPSTPPEDLTDDELADYSEKVRKRLQHFSKGYHDQRRIAEQAAREKSELEAMTARLVEENRKLKGTVSENQKAMLENAKKMIEREIEDRKSTRLNSSH